MKLAGWTMLAVVVSMAVWKATHEPLNKRAHGPNQPCYVFMENYPDCKGGH